MADRVTIFDTTLRDGEQAPGLLADASPRSCSWRGSSTRSAWTSSRPGFPIASAGRRRGGAAGRRRGAPAGHRRARPLPARRHRPRRRGARAAPRGRASTPSSPPPTCTSSASCASRASSASRRPSPAVTQARQYTDDVEFSAEDATRSDLDFLCRVVEAVIDAGATTINLPDTVGYSTPDEITDVLHAPCIGRVPNARQAVFSTHCHDDLGLAVANTLAALHGRRAAGGVHDQRHRRARRQRVARGDRDGHARASDRAAVRRPASTRQQLFATSQLLTALTGEPVQANKAIVGRNAFAHEAGIHQDGMLKDRRTYEIMRPEDVGVPPATLVLGKHSGRHAVQHRLQQPRRRAVAPRAGPGVPPDDRAGRRAEDGVRRGARRADRRATHRATSPSRRMRSSATSTATAPGTRKSGTDTES